MPPCPLYIDKIGDITIISTYQLRNKRELGLKNVNIKNYKTIRLLRIVMLKPLNMYGQIVITHIRRMTGYSFPYAVYSNMRSK